MTRAKVKSIFEILGIIFPLMIFLLVTIFSFSLPAYNSVNEYVSVLGSNISPYRVIVNVLGFVFLGLIILALGYIFSEELGKNHFSKTATRLFMSSGMLLMLLGIFPTDSGYDLVTFEGRMHSIIGKIVFVLLPISIIWFGLAFRKEAEWGKFWTIISFSLAGIAFFSVMMLGVFHLFDGLTERIGIGANLLWVFLVSINLFLSNINFPFKIYERDKSLLWR